MHFDPKELEAIDALIQKSVRILIIAHKSPDGDTIGSAMAAYHVFSEMGKAPEVVCMDSAPPEFNFLPSIEKFKKGQPVLNYDMYFVMDAGADYMTGFHETHPDLFNGKMEVVNVDHHQSNDRYGKYNIVITDAPSNTAILHELFTALNYPINRLAATCLLTGIYTDTGSFMHSNTTAEVMRIAGRLLAKGADLRSISKDIFRTTKISTMRLWGRVLKSVTRTSDGVTMAVVRQKDFTDTGADYSEMTGAADYVSSVPGSTYSVILTEREGKVKGSLRTLKDEVDVAQIAAGFTLSGHLEQETRWKVVN